MIIEIESLKFEVGNIETLKRGSNSGDYFISQIPNELYSFIKKSIYSGNEYKSIKVFNSDSLYLDLEDCLFKQPDFITRTAYIYAGWVN